MGQKMRDYIGIVVLKALERRNPIDVSGLTKMSKNDEGLMVQPEMPKYKLALVEIFDTSKATGGSDKELSGHSQAIKLDSFGLEWAHQPLGTRCPHCVLAG